MKPPGRDRGEDVQYGVSVVTRTFQDLVVFGHPVPHLFTRLFIDTSDGGCWYIISSENVISSKFDILRKYWLERNKTEVVNHRVRIPVGSCQSITIRVVKPNKTSRYCFG